MKIAELLGKRKVLIDKRLDDVLPKESARPKRLHKAMRYSVFSGGKRVRPILSIESCLCCGGRIDDIMPAACAIELVHTFSLIHDDLPAMDNDNYRRGKPACHRKFDEATAILAGDALLALAFKIMAQGVNTKTEVRLIRELAGSIGSLGMAGGQSIDIEYEGKRKSLATLNYINLYKTGALIKSALKMGAIAAGASHKEIESIGRFGSFIGEAFQIMDDILDKGGYTAVFGKDKSYKKAKFLTGKAKESLLKFGSSADALRTIADYLAERKF